MPRNVLELGQHSAEEKSQVEAFASKTHGILSRVLLERKTGTSRCHHMTLLSLALSVGARNILELGHGVGTAGETAEPLVLAASLSGGRVTSVDMRPSGTFLGRPEDRKHWDFVQSDSIAFLRASAERGDVWDLVVVDDWHDTHHVARELKLLTRVTRPDTLILMHDIMTTALHPESVRITNGGRLRRTIEREASSARYNPESLGAEWGQYSTGYGVFSLLDHREWEWATIPACHGLTMLRRKGPKGCWAGAGFRMPPGNLTQPVMCPY